MKALRLFGLAALFALMLAVPSAASAQPGPCAPSQWTTLSNEFHALESTSVDDKQAALLQLTDALLPAQPYNCYYEFQWTWAMAGSSAIEFFCDGQQISIYGGLVQCAVVARYYWASNFLITLGG